MQYDTVPPENSMLDPDPESILVGSCKKYCRRVTVINYHEHHVFILVAGSCTRIPTQVRQCALNRNRLQTAFDEYKAQHKKRY